MRQESPQQVVDNAVVVTVVSFLSTISKLLRERERMVTRRKAYAQTIRLPT